MLTPCDGKSMMNYDWTVRQLWLLAILFDHFEAKEPFSDYCVKTFPNAAWYEKGQKCVVAVTETRSWDEAFLNCSKWPVLVTQKAIPPFSGRLITIPDTSTWHFVVQQFDDLLDGVVDEMLQWDFWIGLRKTTDSLKSKANSGISASDGKSAKELEAEALIGSHNEPSSYGWTFSTSATAKENPTCSWTAPNDPDGKPVEHWFSNPLEDCVRIRGNLHPMEWWDVGCWERYKYFCEFVETKTNAESCGPDGVYIEQNCYKFEQGLRKMSFSEAHSSCLKSGGVVASFLQNCTHQALMNHAKNRGVDNFWVGMKRNIAAGGRLEVSIHSNGCGAVPVEVEFDGSTLDNLETDNMYDGPWMLNVESGQLVPANGADDRQAVICMMNDCADSIVCENKGICTRALTGVSRCSCAPGFSGKTCQSERSECAVDPCLSDPCVHSVKCHTTEDETFICECLPGFTGNICEIEIDECDSAPCVNGATCVDMVNAYSCICVPGFSGANCQINIDECQSDPCRHESTCIDLINMYSCDCTPGYTDVNCETDIDECESSPCVNRGQCSDNVNSFYCQCSPAFDGFTCEVPLTSCTWAMLDESSARIAMLAQQTTTSIVVIAAMAVLIILFLLLRDFSYERIIHMCEEISLLLAHVFILFFRTPYLFDTAAFCDPSVKTDPVKLPAELCTVQAMVFHFIFQLFFVLLTAESLHNYTIFTYVSITGPILTMKRFLQLCVFFPFAVVTYTSIRHFPTYSNENTCWISINSINFYLEFLPISVFAAAALVISEATGMDMVPGMGSWPQLPFVRESDRFTAQANSKGGLIIPLLAYFSWIIGANAVDNKSMPLYTASFFINCGLSFCIVVFHTLGNHRARTILVLIFWTLPKEMFNAVRNCCCPKKRKKRKRKRKTGFVQTESEKLLEQKASRMSFFRCLCCRKSQLNEDEEWVTERIPEEKPQKSIFKRIKEQFRPPPAINTMQAASALIMLSQDMNGTSAQINDVDDAETQNIESVHSSLNGDSPPRESTPTAPETLINTSHVSEIQSLPSSPVHLSRSLISSRASKASGDQVNVSIVEEMVGHCEEIKAPSISNSRPSELNEVLNIELTGNIRYPKHERRSRSYDNSHSDSADPNATQHNAILIEDMSHLSRRSRRNSVTPPSYTSTQLALLKPPVNQQANHYKSMPKQGYTHLTLLQGSYSPRKQLEKLKPWKP